MADYSRDLAEELSKDETFLLLSDIMRMLESSRIWNGSGWTLNPIHPFRYELLIPMVRDKLNSITEQTAAVKAASESIDEADIVFLLNKRAEIRRQISSRKSVQEGKPDRIATLLERAALEITMLRSKL